MILMMIREIVGVGEAVGGEVADVLTMRSVLAVFDQLAAEGQKLKLGY